MQEDKILYFYYEEGRGSTIVFKDGHTLKRKEAPEIFINQMCYQNGSTLNLRAQFLKDHFNYRQKIPIIIDLKREIIFFPVFGRENALRVWLQFRCVKKIRQEDPYTYIYFENDTFLCLAVYFRTIQKQLRRCKDIIKIQIEI